MRVVHKNTDAAATGDWLNKAKQLEKEGEWTKAAAAYEKVIKRRPKNELAHDRLMIIYRKEKEYKKELAAITRAIRIFEDAHKDSSRVKTSKRLVSLSRSLLRSLNMVDKKGKLLYEAEPVNRWRKRKTVVEGKISKT